jgi:hypothetical protein
MLLGSNEWSTAPAYGTNNLRWVYAWTAPLSAADLGSFAAVDPWTTNTAGYGPYIIDAYSDSEYTGADIALWHTISVWQGDSPTSPTPYGVYTGSEVVPWP